MPTRRAGRASLPEAPRPGLLELDRATRALIRLSASITGGAEVDVRRGLAACARAGVPDAWVEELILQSYLFAGFPRALNAAREWSRAGTPGAAADGYENVYEWRLRGAETCAVVYGEMYEKLRANIQRLHPTLDDWMIVEGYGKVLSRPGLDLPRRELCIVAACVAARQDRQLHSHLHGAVNAGVEPGVVTEAIGALDGVVTATALKSARLLWRRVKGH